MLLSRPPMIHSLLNLNRRWRINIFDIPRATKFHRALLRQSLPHGNGDARRRSDYCWCHLLGGAILLESVSYLLWGHTLALDWAETFVPPHLRILTTPHSLPLPPTNHLLPIRLSHHDRLLLKLLEKEHGFLLLLRLFNFTEHTNRLRINRF